MALPTWIKSLRPGRKSNTPARETKPYPTLALIGQPQTTRRYLYKPTPRNLRFFAKTTFASRAIRAIKNPIAETTWEIRPKAGVEKNSEILRQIAAVTAAFSEPNPDDNFRSLIEAVIADICCGAGAIEQQLTGNPQKPVALWPVDGLSIQIYPAWSGDPDEARYAQTIGYGGLGGIQGNHMTVELRNDELVYIRPDPSTASPFGTGPLEIAFQSIARKLGVEEYAGNVAGNATPSVIAHLGDDIDAAGVQAFRTFWENDIEGQGKIPFIGGATKPTVLNLRSGGDTALYLQYQEMLIMEIAAAFCLDPANLGQSKMTNRDSSESAEDRDWDHAIRPMASLIATYLTREIINAKLGFSQIEFTFRGLDRKDELAAANIAKQYYGINVMTPNEIREQLGMPRTQSFWGDKMKADADIAVMAARGTGLVDDNDMPGLNKDSDTQLGANIVKDTGTKPVPRSKQGPTPPQFLPVNPLKNSD